VWLGFSQALKPCQAGLTISIDAAFSAFTRGGMSLVELMAEICNCSTADLKNGLDFEHNRIGRLIRGIRVGEQGPAVGIGGGEGGAGGCCWAPTC
jgi:hypothetical protein